MIIILVRGIDQSVHGRRLRAFLHRLEYLFPLSVRTLQSLGLCSPLQKRHVCLVGCRSVGGGTTGVCGFNVMRYAAVAAVVELLLSYNH